MGIGPAGTSLLIKLGQLPAHEMSVSDLRILVEKDRARRSEVRAMARARKIAGPVKPKAVKTLEEFGLTPAIAARLRATGKSEPELIALIQRSGLI